MVAPSGFLNVRSTPGTLYRTPSHLRDTRFFGLALDTFLFCLCGAFARDAVIELGTCFVIMPGYVRRVMRTHTKAARVAAEDVARRRSIVNLPGCACFGGAVEK
tara:strand:- start:40442 stop:40753 length:312 start_codon:yes stop_codon:yes gene_type:complete